MEKVMVFLLGCLLLLGGCNSKTDEAYQNSIQKGLDAVAEDNFSKAEGLFEVALESKENDETAKAYLNQVQLILEADDLVEQNKIEDAIKLLNQSIQVKAGSKVISSKSEDKKDELTAVQENLKNYTKTLTDAKKLNKADNYEKSNDKLDALLKEDLTKFVEIKDEAEKLKDSNNEAIKRAEIAQAKKEAEATVAAENQAKAEAVKNKVEEYRQQVWYGRDEDPDFTWDDAYNIIVDVLGEEDGTFLYNGRVMVYMDDNGRKYYSIWKEDPNAASTADGTMAVYNVYDDGTVEPQ
ncbi:hypothetical protein [Peribacillus sp. Hz7]|uniref:hypothetical protein n=1 Tax=Peribacillus sp. Hz7 TaxID=3344873 RepID=UPI0035CA1D8D